jgi:hypothetical protein
MDFKRWLEETQKFFPFMLSKYVSPEEVEQNRLFGPVYHGTTEENRERIQHQGFQFFKGLPRQGDVRHGFDPNDFAPEESPPPIHFLGFGVYFTVSLNIAKQFNVGKGKGLKAYYIGGRDKKPPRIEEINYGAKNTIRKWWAKYGYNMPSRDSFKTQEEFEQRWQAETAKLTSNLKAEFDAVHFKGKGFRGSLLDGNQICVYRPEECIYTIDPKLSPGYETENGTLIRPGDRIQIRGTRATAYVGKISPARTDTDPWNWAYPSRYEILVGDLKGMDEIVRVHGPMLLRALQKADKENYPIMVTRQQNFGAGHVEAWYDYNTKKEVFSYKVPSALIAGVLKPGQRVK